MLIWVKDPDPEISHDPPTESCSSVLVKRMIYPHTVIVPSGSRAEEERKEHPGYRDQQEGIRQAVCQL